MADDFGDFGVEKKKKKEKKEKKRSGYDDLVFDDMAGMEASQLQTTMGEVIANADQVGLTRDADNTAQFQAAADGTIVVEGGTEDVLRNIAMYFDCIRALDVGVYQEVGKSIVDMDEELRKVRKDCCDMEYSIQNKYKDAATADAECKVYEQMLRDAQVRLAALHHDRRGINVNHLSVGDDRNRIAEEMTFLLNAIEQEEETLLLISRSTAFLQKSFEHIQAHHKVLEQQKLSLLEHVKGEKAKMARELQQTKEMREQEEKMRHEQKVDITARAGQAAFAAADDILQTPLDKGPSNQRRMGGLAGI